MGERGVSSEDAMAIEAVIFEHDWLSDHGRHEELADLYAEGVVARQDSAGLKQRHTTTNLRLMPLEGGDVAATAVLSVYRPGAEGGDTVPSAIVDCEFAFRRGG